MLRGIFLGISLALALIAGALYYGYTREVGVVVAAQDLKVGTRVTDDQVQVRRVHPNSLPEGAVRTAASAVGRYITFPVLAGQYVPARALADRPASGIGSGVDVPPGFRIVSIPISPAMAVGGALRPGDHVDVFAVAATTPGTAFRSGSTSAGGGGGSGMQESRASELVGRHVLVLGLRSEQGTALEDTPKGNRGLNLSNARIGSLLLAIPPEEAARYSAAAAGATFFVALTID